MSGVNRVIIVGNLARDPEIRSLTNGSRVCNMTVATSEQWKDKGSGEKKEKAEFHRVVIFNGHLVKLAESYLAKGAKVYLEGSLQTRSWEKDGQKNYTTEIVLQRYRGELQILSSPVSQSGDGAPAAEPESEMPFD